ncbi:MAG: DUF4097 domain-containing protein, partial [Acidaminococcales bacterium]|nr:DUF4097 domain-containing protein [Acidaminococcales bacterium]
NDGELEVTDLAAGRDVKVTHAGEEDIVIGELTAARDAAIQAANGNISVTEAKVGNDLKLATTVTGNIEVLNDFYVGHDAALTTATGDIDVLDAIAGHNLRLVTDTGDINVETIAAGNDMYINISTRGDLTAGDPTLDNPDVFFDGLLSAGWDINIDVPHGNVTVDHMYAGNNIDVSMRDGDFLSYYILVDELNLSSSITVHNAGDGKIDAEYVRVGRNATLQTIGGDIWTTDMVADNGDIDLITVTGSIHIKDQIWAGGNDYIYVGIGDIDDLAVDGKISDYAGSIVLKTGSGSIKLSSLKGYQNVTLESISKGVLSNKGDIDVGTVTAENGNIVLTAHDGFVHAGTLDAENGGVTLEALGESSDIDPKDIDVKNIIAAKDVKAAAEDGNITVVNVTGTDLWFGIAENGRTVDIDNAVAHKSLFAQGEFIDIAKLTHAPAAGDGDYFQFHLRGAGGSQAMKKVAANVDSPIGVQLDQLWTETGEINVSSEYFRVMDAYAKDKAYLRNSRYRMTLFGRNPVPDDADIQIYFAPSPGNPFGHVSFQNEFSYLGLENYKILHAKDGVVNVVTNQRSLLDDTAIAIAADGKLSGRGYAGGWLADSVHDYGRYLSLSYDSLDVLPLDGIYRGGYKLRLGNREGANVLYFDDASERQNWQILDEKRKML